jgi:hypothetical protein
MDSEHDVSIDLEARVTSEREIILLVSNNPVHTRLAGDLAELATPQGLTRCAGGRHGF